MKKRYGFFSIGVLILITIVCGSIYVYKKNNSVPYLTVFGTVNMKDGIGRQSVDLIQALKDEVSINFISTDPVRTLDVPQEILPFLKKKNKLRGEVAILEDVVWLPNHASYKKFVRNTSKRQIKIAYSMFESTAIPYEWVFIFNNCFDAVVVPDRFLIDVYKRCGVKIPIFELPLGLHLDAFLKESLPRKAHHPIVFGNLGVCVERKNQLTLLRAFAKAFGDSPDVLLRINCRSGDDLLIEVIREEIDLLGLHNVEFTQTALNGVEYLNLFKKLDCLVSLSKGEGYSIQPREAMALGIPVVITDNTAQSSLCRSGYARVVPSNIAEEAFYFGGMNCGEWYNCSVDEAAEALIDVYTNYEIFLEKAMLSREWVQKYRYKNLKQFYINLVKPKQVILGHEDKITEEYLMTTSEKLWLKYIKINRQ
ncbi:MAG: glycosyltransferase family 4 protein [Chlamydiota bacterium]